MIFLFLNIILVLLPLSLYMWVGYGPIYRSENTFTKRWPDFQEMKNALNEPGISLIRKGIIRRFGYLLAAYYIMLALVVTCSLAFCFA
jgi:hypothetical protein